MQKRLAWLSSGQIENVSPSWTSLNAAPAQKREVAQHLMCLKATMGMFQGNRDSRLTDEGAAEHLWTMFISPIQR